MSVRTGNGGSRLRRRARRLGAAGSLLLLAALGIGQTRPFELASAIPDDFFVVTAERPNPERAFLDAYWGEVRTAFWESGVTERLLELALSRADESAHQELERIRERFGALCGAVDWSAFSGEVVFGERLRAPVRIGREGLASQPDMALLFRMEPGSAQAAFEGLRAILAAGLEELAALAPVRLELTGREEHGGQFVVLDFTQLAEEAPAMPLSIGWREDVLVVTLGPGVREQVGGLLAGTGEMRAITDTERFRAAFAALPEPEDGFEFVDMHNLRSGIEEMLEGFVALAEAEVRPAPRSEILNARRNPQANELRQQGLLAYQEGRYREALELTLAAYEVDPGDTVVLFNLACLHALLDEPDAALGWLDQAVEGGFHAPDQILGDADLDSLHGLPRFEAAVERAAELAGPGPEDWLGFVRHVLGRGLGALAVLDSGAVVHRTEGCSVHSIGLTALAPDAAAHPFHAVIAAGRPVADFARYLPVETASFSVAGGGGILELYDFLEDSLAGGGLPGRRALALWRDFQLEHEFDVREDVLGWIDGEHAWASFELGGESAWVLRLKVSDEARAREQIELALEAVPELLADLVGLNPAFAMLNLRVGPTGHEDLGGFHDVALAMMPRPMVCGLKGGWLIVGSSAEAVLLTEATGAGEHPNVRANEALMAAAIVPDGPVSAVSFSDRTGEGETMSAILTGVATAVGMSAAAIPEPEAREVVVDLARIAGELAPVVAEIDFTLSTAKLTRFDGRIWHEHSVTHYRPPAGD